MASKELFLIINRLMKEREKLAKLYGKIEAQKGDSPELETQSIMAKLKLNIDLPMILFNESESNKVFEDIKVLPVNCNGVKGEWIIANKSDYGSRLMYIHGGAFLFGDLDTHRHLCAQLAKASGCAILSVEYTLANSKPFPTALNDCINAYLWMLENSPSGAESAKSTFIAGDSAGGNLTLSMLLKLKQLNKSTPTAAVTLSASTDETRSQNSWVTMADLDPVLGDFAQMLREGAGRKSLYIQDHDPRNPMISPIFGDLHGLPPILMQVGELECICSESEEFANKAKLAGVDVTLEIWPEMIHVWQVFAPILPEASRAIERIASFIKYHKR